MFSLRVVSVAPGLPEGAVVSDTLSPSEPKYGLAVESRTKYRVPGGFPLAAQATDIEETPTSRCVCAANPGRVASVTAATGTAAA